VVVVAVTIEVTVTVMVVVKPIVWWLEKSGSLSVQDRKFKDYDKL
jgi:hypothetical protein